MHTRKRSAHPVVRVLQWIWAVLARILFVAVFILLAMMPIPFLSAVILTKPMRRNLPAQVLRKK